MKRSTIQTILLVAGITVFAVGMLVSFTPPAAAHDTETDVEGLNADLAEQNQTSVAGLSVEVYHIEHRGVTVAIGATTGVFDMTSAGLLGDVQALAFRGYPEDGYVTETY